MSDVISGAGISLYNV